MKLTLAASTLALIGATSSLAEVVHQPRSFSSSSSFHAQQFKRSVSGNGNTLADQTFDYVIVGGGLAGLTLASRLSEDADVTVAVIEAGADAWGPDQAKFLTPASNLHNSALDTQYDWQWKTTAQSALNGRQVNWPRGKVLGGSSAINGLYMVRASKVEHDAWGKLTGSPEIWGWDNMYRAMKKSETFTPPNAQVQATLPKLKWDASSHGTNGSVHTSWPAVAFSSTNDFLTSMAATGTANNDDPNSGKAWGSFVATSAIDPAKNQRSFARNAYLDPAADRPNLSILTGHFGLKVNFDRSDPANLKATGVQYGASAGETVHTINARREVILAGGAINSPQLLQVSGIGEPEHLKSIGVETLVDLPGVGQNLQDHLSSSVIFAPNQGVDRPADAITGNAAQDSYVNSAIGYVNITTLLTNRVDSQLASARAEMESTISSADVRDEVKRAWRTTMQTQLDDVLNPSSSVGPIEILYAFIFGGVHIQVALQHPLSRGSILAQSASTFDAPAIDAGYLTATLDRVILREGFKLARRVGQTPPLSNSLASEQVPGSSVQSNEQWENWIITQVGTEYHPIGSVSCLPREDGGVVDSRLLVYGTSNLRVIDSSVQPVAHSHHSMTSTYAVAEIGAEILKAARAGTTYTGSNPPIKNENSNAGSVSNSGSNSGNAGSGSTSSSSAAGLLRPTALVAALAVVAGSLALFA